MGVEATWVRQHPQSGGARGPGLGPKSGAGLPESRPVGGDADDRQPPRAEALGLLQQLAAALAQFIIGELVGARGGPGDDVGDAESQAEQLLLLVGPQLARGESGPVEG